MYHGKYAQRETVHFTGWYNNGTIWYDWTENPNHWTHLYPARHYQNIPEDERLYDVAFWFSGGNYGWIWTLII